MEKKQVSTKNVLIFCGAIISFCIGAGFATGQEVLQFFTSFGYWGVGGILISLIIYIFMCSAFMTTGNTANLGHPGNVFQYYCGKTLGVFFEWFSALLVFLLFIVMLAGSGAVFADYYHLPATYGRIFMVALTTVAVIVGFERLLNILGPLGPIIVIGCITIAIAAIVKNTEGFSTATDFIASTPMLKASSTWWLSGILYAAFMSIPLAAFLAESGAAATSKKEAAIGGIAGAVAFCGGALLIILAQIANVAAVYDKGIPTLFLAQEVMPILAAGFSVIILAGIFTTAAPLLWTAVIKFADNGTKKFKMVTLVMAAAAFIVSFLPFSTLVNIIYPASGWLGIVLVILMAVKHIRLAGEKKTVAEQPADSQ